MNDEPNFSVCSFIFGNAITQVYHSPSPELLLYIIHWRKLFNYDTKIIVEIARRFSQSTTINKQERTQQHVWWIR